MDEEVQKPGRGLKDVLQIASPGSEDITDHSMIDRLVEEPVRRAVHELYDRNIRTYMSSANLEANSDGVANVSMYFDFLSDTNKSIVMRLIHEGVAEMSRTDTGAPLVKLLFSVDPGEPVWADIVESQSVLKVSELQKQPFLWCTRYTEARLAAIFGAQSGEFSIEDWKKEGYVFDPETELFFLSSDHIQKFHDSMKEFGHDKDGNPVDSRRFDVQTKTFKPHAEPSSDESRKFQIEE